MKKSIIFLLLLLSLTSLAQDGDDETSSEVMDSTPVEIGEPPTDNFEQINPEEPEQSNEIDAQVTPATSQSEEELHTAEVKSQDVAMSEASMPTLSTRAPEEERFLNPRKSHWLVSLGFEGMEYILPYEFDGIEKDFKKSTVSMYGGRLGLGGELYLGKGFMTSTKVEGFYMGTTFTQAKNAGPEEEDVELAYTKDNGQIFGADVVQTLSYIFDFKTKNPIMDEMTYLTLEPFILAGFGTARAFNKKRYQYDLTPTYENYEQSFYDELTNAKIGGGINFTSRQGFFLYLSATQNRFDISSRKTKGYRNSTEINGTDKNAKIDPVMVYALGGGYKF